MKILCVCSQGNKRSVHTRFNLNHKHDALALGVDVNSPETIALLCNWAEVILLAEPTMIYQIPMPFVSKVDERFTIGADVYPTNILRRLNRNINKELKNLGYL